MHGDQGQKIAWRVVARLHWWIRYRSLLWWGIALVALTTAALIWRANVERLRSERAALTNVEWVTVATKDLAAGTTLTAEDLTVEQRPRAFLPQRWLGRDDVGGPSGVGRL